MQTCLLLELVVFYMDWKMYLLDWLVQQMNGMKNQAASTQVNSLIKTSGVDAKSLTKTYPVLMSVTSMIGWR